MSLSREFNSVAELKQHYRDVFSRRPPQEPPVPIMAKPPKPEPKAPPKPKALPDHGMWRAVAVVCEFYNVTWQQIKDPDRTLPMVEVRHLFFYLAREIGKQPFARLGRMTKRDHTTVLHAYHKIKDRIAVDDDYAAKVEVLKQRFLSGRTQ